MTSKSPSAVELMIREWLNGHTQLLNAIIEQIAAELAPIAAEQALAELRTRLAGLQTRDDLVNKLEAALREAQLWFACKQYEEEEWREPAEDTTRRMINEALTVLDMYRGLALPTRSADVDDQVGADRGGEGGAS